MRISVQCGQCGQRMATGAFRLNKKNLLNTIVFSCDNCIEVNVVALSMKALDSPRVFPLGRKFHMDRITQYQQEILVDLMSRTFQALQAALADWEVLDQLNINDEEAVMLQEGIAECLADLEDPSRRAEMIKEYVKFFSGPKKEEPTLKNFVPSKN